MPKTSALSVATHEAPAIPIEEQCPDCRGTGSTYQSTNVRDPDDPDVEAITCPACHGTGRKLKPWERIEKCEACDGHGIVYDDAPWLGNPERCEECDGEGTVKRDYLREALHLVSNPHTNITPDRQHLLALTMHYRDSIAALMPVPQHLERIGATMERIGHTLIATRKEVA